MSTTAHRNTYNDEDFHEQIDNIPVEHIEVVQYNRSSSNKHGGSNHRNSPSTDALRSSSHHRRDDSDHWSVTSGLTQAQFHFSQLDVSRLQTDDSLSDFYTDTGGDPLNIITPTTGNGRGIVVTPQQPVRAESDDAVTPVTNRRRRVRDYPLTLTAQDGRPRLYSARSYDGTPPWTTTAGESKSWRRSHSPVPVTGIGVLKFPETGDMYMGEMLKGEMHGVGTYTCAASSPASSPDRKGGSPSNRKGKSAQKSKRKSRAYKVLKGFFHHNVYTGWENKNKVPDEEAAAAAAVLTNRAKAGYGINMPATAVS
jgi:hypothetical protein